jgi:UDP-N-acetylmuramyl pentapeptide synthase
MGFSSGFSKVLSAKKQSLGDERANQARIASGQNSAKLGAAQIGADAKVESARLEAESRYKLGKLNDKGGTKRFKLASDTETALSTGFPSLIDYQNSLGSR